MTVRERKREAAERTGFSEEEGLWRRNWLCSKAEGKNRLEVLREEVSHPKVLH
jgi:hypothetical protein